MFVICGLGHQLNLRIYGLQNKFVDLRFADWHTSKNLQICDHRMSLRICRFAICGLTKKIYIPTLAQTKSRVFFFNRIEERQKDM
jgi:hypothetical protein